MLTLATITALLAIPCVNANLHELAVAAGKLYFGSATDNSQLADKAYTSILNNAAEFGQITPGNGQKWQFTEPNPNSFSFTAGNQITDLAQANNQILRCHTLVWHSQLPSWVSSGTWTVNTLTAAIENHISNVMGHYKGQCYAWDVVNEALDDSGGYRSDVFLKVLGPDYIPIAFKAAAAADPAAKLYYNDYSIENPGGKQQGVLKIIASIKAAGARIDGVGLQGHFIVGSTPSRTALAGVLNSFVAAGVTEVAYTELDIRFSALPSNAAGETQQATDYMSVVGACLDVKECVGVTIWDYSDKYSWIPSTFSGQGDACLFSSNLKPKPAYTSVSSLLQAAASGGAGAPGNTPAKPTTAPAPAPVPTTRAGGNNPPKPTTLLKTTRSAAPVRPPKATASSPPSGSPPNAPLPNVGTPPPSNGGGVQGAAAHYAQCGGKAFTGATACAAPFACKKMNDYYSQCL